jgi:Sugar kinases, ribokinase family
MLTPEIQGRILDQLSDRPRLVALDTMNYWIESKKEALLKVLRRTDLLTINESEARMLTGEFNLVRAADAIRKMGPKIIVLKKGEHGALVFYEGGIFASPAMPLEVVKDPTGAGDSFAGGLLGYLTRHAKLSPEFLRQAAIVGSTMASFCVSDFGVAGTKELTMDQISRRTGEFLDLTAFPRIDIGDRRL